MGIKGKFVRSLRYLGRLLIKLIVILMISMVCVIAIWKGFRADHRLKIALEDKLRAVTTDSLSIGNLQLNLSSVQLKDINYHYKSNLQLRADQCKVEISLIDLAFSGGDWRKSIGKIDISNLNIILNQTENRDSLDTEAKFYSKELYPVLKSIFSMVNVSISNCSVINVDDNSPIIQDMDATFFQDGVSKINVICSGKLVSFVGTDINLIGEIDVQSEELLFDLTINNNDLGNVRLGGVVADVEMLSNYGGWIQSHIEIRGREKLVLTGNLVAHDLEIKYGNLINLRDGNLKAEMFGKEIIFEGDMSINGVKLPFQGVVTDLFNLNWQLNINEDDLDISDLELLTPRKKIISGFSDFKVAVTGDKSGYHGIVQSNSKSISINNVPVKDLQIELSIENGMAIIDSFYARVYGADVGLGGFINMSSGENRIDWFLTKSLSFDESYSWLGLDSNFVSLTGALSGIAGVVIGSGNCEVLDSHGELLIDWDFDIDGYEILGQFDTDQQDVSGRFQIDFSNKPPSILISGRNPHRILRNSDYGKLVNDEFHHYEMEYKIEGDLKNTVYSLYIKSNIAEKSLSMSGVIGYNDHSGLNTTGKLEFSLQSSILSDKIIHRNIMGEYAIAYDDSKFIINDFTFRNDSDTVLFSINAEINLKNKEYTTIDLRLSKLPVPELLRFFYPVKIPALFGTVEGSLITKGQHSDYNFVYNVISEIVPPYSFSIDGVVDGDKLRVNNLALENDDGEKVFGLRGGIDLATMTIDTVVTSADNLIIEDIVRAVTGDNSSNFGGRFNMLAHISGDLPFPAIDMNAHLASAFIHNMSGFWGNMHIVSNDSTYVLKNTDIGLELKKIADVEGRFNRDLKVYNIDLVSTEHDIKDFVQLVTGRSNIISGSSHIVANLNNKDSAHTMSVEVNVNSGKIGTMEFDDLESNFTIYNIGTDNTLLSIDTLGINWGNFTGNIDGIVPLNSEDNMAINGSLNGELMAFLPRISSFFSKPKGSGSFDFKGSGTVKNPYIEKANLNISNGSIKMNDIVRKVTAIDIDLSLDSTGLIKVANFTGKVDDKRFYISNRFPEPESPDTVFSFLSLKDVDVEQSIIIGKYNLGIIQFETGKNGIWARIPGLMERDWGGYAIFSGFDDSGPFEFSGPASRPVGSGKIKLRKATVTYPFIIKEGQILKRFPLAVLALLNRMEWDVHVVPEWGCKYVTEISGLKGMPFYDEIQKSISSPMFNLDLKLFLDIEIDQAIEGLHFSGSISDSFRIGGELHSTKGNIEYLDMKFSTQSIKAEFNQSEMDPLFYGSAVTTVIDSAGIPHEIRLVTRRNAGEGAAGITINQDAPARWDNLNVIFEDDQNNSQEQILALLGYAPNTIEDKLPGLGGSIVEKAIPIKRYTRKLERQLERWLNVDRIDIDPTLTQNIIQQQINSLVYDNRYRGQNGSYLQVFDRSSVTLGKYVTRDIYISYTGMLRNGADKYNFTRLGMLHDWDVLFRLWQIAPNLNLNYRYQYDSIAELSDQSFRIRINFTFDL